MHTEWSFGRKIGGGFAFAVMLTVVIGATAVYALRTTVASKDVVIDLAGTVLGDCQQLETVAEQNVAATRGLLLTQDVSFADQRRESIAEFEVLLARLSERILQGGHELSAIEHAFEEYVREADAVVARRAAGEAVESISVSVTGSVRNKRRQLSDRIQALRADQDQRLRQRTVDVSQAATTAITLVAFIGAIAVLFSAAVALVLTRTLNRQIGSAVGQIQSSSSELQAAANQQAMGSREQSTAMAEITTTISELLATSRQIAESSQRVAQMAGQTAASATTGERTVVRANESIGGVQRQMDQIVSHMLDLGKRSQQIGTVLEIVSELAEQTNILAINATIEASVAGEVGKRFGVVADEIRKLADRVAGSTKEVRGLIDDVRAAVNTTVMATETGAKTVDASSRQFSEVTSSLGQIAGLVSSTTEAAREIELSTKQQSSAVEQVNTAIANVAQATRETEASSSQTLQTVSQLATLSRDLLKLVRPGAGV